MKSETKNLIHLAAEDYEASLYLFQGARHPHAVYYMCQAIEKALKAAQIELTNQVPKKIHNLATLAKHSGLSVSTQHYETLTSLFKHYGRVRYRDYQDTRYNTKAKVEPIITQGKTLYLWILNTLKNHSPSS